MATGTRDAPGEEVPAPVASAGVLAAFSVPGYARLWASGVTWNLTRWLSVFLCSYLVNSLTGSPLLVQATGAAFFAPMFFGGALGGVISDRFDRRRTMLSLLVALAPLALVMGQLASAGALHAWMVYPFMVAVGVGGVIDMTSRRALVFDYVGERLATNAVALETIGALGGTMIGSVIAGSILNFFGFGPAFFVIAAAYGACFVLLAPLRLPGPRGRGVARLSLARDLAAGLSYLRGQRTLISVLGVTVVMNMCFFSYVPLVPVFAEGLGVNALLAGVLASAQGLGAIAGTIAIAHGLPWRRGEIYVGGSVIALACLLVFSLSGSFGFSFLALAGAGLGISGFATMQSLLVLLTADPEMRGRAMGLLSMAIGTLPFAMLVLGGVAQLLWPQAAVALSAATGLLVIGAWSALWPQAARLR